MFYFFSNIYYMNKLLQWLRILLAVDTNGYWLCMSKILITVLSTGYS